MMLSQRGVLGKCFFVFDGMVLRVFRSKRKNEVVVVVVVVVGEARVKREGEVCLWGGRREAKEKLVASKVTRAPMK
jgi:hypothetical protein